VEGSASRGTQGGSAGKAGRLVSACRNKRRDPDGFRRAMQDVDFDHAVAIYYAEFAQGDIPAVGDVPTGEEAHNDAVEYMIRDELCFWSAYKDFHTWGLDLGDRETVGAIGALFVEWHHRCGKAKGG
jgi:hypothetical protein